MSNKKVKNSTCFSIHYYATTALSIMARRVVPAISYNIKIFGFQALYDIISTFCINIINCWEQILFLSILECSLRNYLNISYIQHSLETAVSFQEYYPYRQSHVPFSNTISKWLRCPFWCMFLTFKMHFN